MNVRRVTATVLVQDMDRALRFYRDTLSFAVEQEAEEWALFREGMGLMVSPEPLPQDSLQLNAILLSLETDDVHAAYGSLIERGVAFLVPPTDVGGAIVATFRDSEGNLLQLVQTTL